MNQKNPYQCTAVRIWGSGNNDILEKVHLKFCKIILHLKATTPNCMKYGELGRYPLDIHINRRNILYQSKLITGKDMKLSIISYRLLYLSQNNNCQFSWLNYVESILNESGLSYVWLNQYFISEQWLKNFWKTCLQDQFYKTWHANIDTGSKTLNYRLFKNRFEFENYFNILDDRDIFTLCRFRLNNHKLPVEQGRWKNVSRELIICNLCNTADLGDEFLYLLKCNYFSENRKPCLDKQNFKNCNILKFGTLMNLTKKIENKKTLHLYKTYQ